MEKVSAYPCFSTMRYNRGQISQNSHAVGSSETTNIGIKSAAPLMTDTINLKSKKAIYEEKLNKLFPNGEFEKVYDKITKDFEIDIQPSLSFVGNDDGIAAGGFNFEKNTITLSLEDIMGSDTKIVGIKNGKRTILFSPSVKLPLFVNKEGADAFVEKFSKAGKLGYDELVVEPVTPEEQRNFIIQKVSHEMIHAQQHMFIRQTEGMGEKEIIKAWTHAKPKNLIEKALLDFKTDVLYKNSYWADKPETKKTIPQNSGKAILAKIWLEAIRNYPKVDSPEYVNNALEKDAYNRSAAYAWGQKQ